MEQKETFAGLQLSRDGAQITWYGEGVSEPQTLVLPSGGDSGMLELPVSVWKGIIMGGSYSLETLSTFLKELLEQVPGKPDLRRIGVCVTLPELKPKMSENLARAMEKIGIERRNLYFQDWRTSFYYYVVNKRRELWNGDVAFLQYKNERMIGHILHIDRSVRPGVVSISEVASTDVSDSVRAGRSDEDWDRERDRLFYELLGKLFERRNVTTSYLYGTYFDRSWAVRSFQYLTFRRHAFQGQNLFSKGACYGAMARAGRIHMPDLIFSGVDMVSENVGIQLRVRGKEQYYPLVSAGVNWYEAHSSCEIIPDAETSIAILTSPMKEGETVRHLLRLDHFPDRKNRATRLRMTLYFTSQKKCTVEVEDLGFGGFYPPSGRVWKREIRIQGDAE